MKSVSPAQGRNPCEASLRSSPQIYACPLTVKPVQAKTTTCYHLGQPPSPAHSNMVVPSLVSLFLPLTPYSLNSPSHKGLCKNQREAAPLGFAVPQSCPTLCNPMHCSLPGSSVHGIILTLPQIPQRLPIPLSIKSTMFMAK